MGLIEALCFLPLVGAGCTYGYFILKPLIQTAAHARFDSRFQLSDFFWLAVLLQMPLMYLAYILRQQRSRLLGNNEIFVYLLGVLLLIVVTYLWWRGATRLTALGVRDTRRRCIFLIVLLPVAVLGSLAAVPSVMLSVSAINGFDDLTDPFRVMCLLAPIILVTIGIACHHLTRWVIADPDAARSVADDDRGQGPPPMA